MKRQRNNSFPPHMSHGEGGKGNGYGKRHGSLSDQLIPPKHPRTAKGEHSDKTNYSSSVCSTCSKDKDNPAIVCSCHQPETTSSIVPNNTNSSLCSDLKSFKNVTEHSYDEIDLSSAKLEKVSSETETSTSLYKGNGEGLPVFSSFTPEVSGSVSESRDGPETNFYNDTTIVTSFDIDKLCCDLNNKVPKSISDSEDFVVVENNDKIQCYDATSGVIAGKIMLGTDYEEHVPGNSHSTPSGFQPEMCHQGSSENIVNMQTKNADEKDEGADITFGRLLVDDNEMPKENVASSKSRQCIFSVGMVTDKHSLTDVPSSLEGDAFESLDKMLSISNGNADVYRPVGMASQQNHSQDICVPGTSQEHAAASDGEDDDHSVESYNSDVPDDEIEAMLEEGLLRRPDKCEQMVQFYQREKIVLDELGHDHFDVLPEGWVKVTHNSGMPVYLHKGSRVCNVTKPYFLGPGSTRKHEIPLSAIPCLQYRRALEEELASSENISVTVGPGGIELPNACIETAEENKARYSLSAEQVYDYCKKKFTTKVINVTRVKKVRHKKKQRNQKQISRPTLPEGTKLIKFPVENKRPVLNNIRKKKEWILNPNGKSYVCILHEYVQHALKKQPSYIFKETEQPEQPYSASVMIDQVQYGVGCGSSKKHAKSEAAKQTLEILIPEMREKIEEDRRAGHCKASASCNTDLSIFDEIRIEDPRVAELCAKTTEPSPYAILLTCLQRNFGLGELDISCEVRSVRHLNIEYMMTVGKHTAVVMCKNKRDGKQRTSQAILQKLHPHIKSWGSILRMYGSSSIKSLKDKKQEEQEITFLQSKAEENEPNYAILRKLEDTMFKLAREYRSMGKFIPPSDEKLPSCSGADLNTVNM